MKLTILKSTFWLVVISIISKAFSFFVRILLARNMDIEAMNYYTLVAPTMIFIITVAQFGIPSAISKVVAASNNPHSPLKASIIISVIQCLVTSTIFIVLIPLISTTIFNKIEVISILDSIIPLIPCVCLSGLIKGYLFGRSRHLEASASQLFEESARILFLFFIFYVLKPTDHIEMATFAMLSISVGEIASSVYMLCVIFANWDKKKQHRCSLHNLKSTDFVNILSVSIPMTGSRFIGSLTYFLEPIVMVIGLNAVQQSSMISTYGQLNGYILPIITMPSFITISLSNFLLPAFTRAIIFKNQETAKRLLTNILSICFAIGMVCGLICFFYSDQLLMLFYRNTRGSELLKQLAFPFVLYSLQPPLSSLLHAISKSKNAVFDTLCGSLVRLSLILIGTAFFGPNVLVYAICFGMLVTTLFHSFQLVFALKSK